MLSKKIYNRESGIITYGLTPPKMNNTHEKITEIAHKQIERIRSIDIDGLVIYDIQDESARIKDERPFPFITTVDSVEYCENYLKELDIPKIIYRCVGKYTPEQLSAWINTNSQNYKFSVFVGASSRNQEIKLGLKESYKLARSHSNLLLGGVAIPERHTKQNDEHLRVIDKLKNGCSFFISQVTYNLEVTKNFLSDYYYYCKDNGIDMVPVLFTITPCGSLQTLEFMKWLGISVPRWLENDLKRSEDILDKSLSLSKKVFEELLDYSLEKRIPIGCNIESLSVRKLEIDASIQLVKDITDIFRKRQIIRN